MNLFEEKEITVGEFRKILEQEGGEFEIECPTGWEKINVFYDRGERDSVSFVVNGIETICSEDHKFLNEKGWKKAVEFDEGEIIRTKNGLKPVESIKRIGKRKVYDLWIESDEHAYYSNGLISHNCGKSTLSRIIAMGLNCEKGDTVEPCLECPSCKAALAGEALHINEFNMSALSCKDDADNIVNGMQNACFTGRNRVYIMDEAQGMSSGSQNLLLKTLENPPEGVYIIICTTNPEKLLKTVRARCEQYEFKNPSINDIKLLLAAVVKQEMPEMNIEQRKEILDACLGLSYREILMKLDKFIKGGGTDNISEAFQANYFDFAKMVLKGDYPAVLKYIDESKDDFDIEAARRMLRVFLCNQISYSPWCANAIKSAQAFRIFDKGFYTDPNPMPSFKVDLFEACNLFRKTE